MNDLDLVIIRGKEQILRDRMQECMRAAEDLLKGAQAHGSMYSTATHQVWRELENAREAIKRAADAISDLSSRYIESPPGGSSAL